MRSTRDSVKHEPIAESRLAITSLQVKVVQELSPISTIGEEPDFRAHVEKDHFGAN